MADRKQSKAGVRWTVLKMKMLQQAVQEASQPVSAGFSVREQLWRCGHAVTWEEEAALGTFVGTVFMSINRRHQYLEQRKALPLPAVWVIASLHMAEFTSRTHKLRTSSTLHSISGFNFL